MPAPIIPVYTNTTLVQARTQLSLRLQDAGFVYWSSTSIDSLIIAALRTLQALTNFYREYDTFPLSSLTADTAFTDLSTITFNGAGTDNIFGYSITNTSLLTSILNHLLEFPVFTTQFSSDQISTALQNRINQFLLDTGMVITRLTPFPPVTSLIGRVSLPSSTLAVRRAAFVDSTRTDADDNLSPLTTPLWRQDEFAGNSFNVGWQQAPITPPTTFSTSAAPPDTLQLIPPPSNDGELDLLTVQSFQVEDGVAVGVPDDFTQYVMWGALADLLSADGQARDPNRAHYCRERYEEGVAVALTFPAILTADVNGVNAYTCAVSELDSYTPNWQNLSGVPLTIGVGGRNIIAPSPLPDTGPYSIGVNLVRNMIVPVMDGDFLQIPPDMLDPLLDYAQHIASFKMGGAEFYNTIPMYQSFLSACGRMNSRLTAMNFYRTAMAQPALRQSAVVELTTQPPQSTQPSAFPSVYPSV